jgi:hypothetical protein
MLTRSFSLTQTRQNYTPLALAVMRTSVAAVEQLLQDPRVDLSAMCGVRGLTLAALAQEVQLRMLASGYVVELNRARRICRQLDAAMDKLVGEGLKL